MGSNEPIFFCIPAFSNHQSHSHVPEELLQVVLLLCPAEQEQLIVTVTLTGVNVIDSPEIAVKVTVVIPSFSGNTLCNASVALV